MTQPIHQTNASGLIKEMLDQIEHLPGDDGSVLTLERLPAKLLHLGAQRVREQPINVDGVPVTTYAEPPVAGRPGLAAPPPPLQFLDDREERPLLQVQAKHRSDGLGFVFVRV